jgi:hypothetical protein
LSQLELFMVEQENVVFEWKEIFLLKRNFLFIENEFNSSTTENSK